jgi:hypothetical protein
METILTKQVHKIKHSFDVLHAFPPAVRALIFTPCLSTQTFSENWQHDLTNNGVHYFTANYVTNKWVRAQNIRVDGALGKMHEVIQAVLQVHNVLNTALQVVCNMMSQCWIEHFQTKLLYMPPLIFII